MGFYHPSTLVTDAGRHGVGTLPIDVARSAWRCELEAQPGSAPPAVRQGQKYEQGLREELARRVEAARAERPFDSLADIEARVGANAADLSILAAVGAFGALGGTRRQAQ